ncbi:MAG: DUF6515 family protein [Bacteroidota bacterium]
MKTLKHILLIVALIGGMVHTNAQQPVVRVYPRHGTVVTTLTSPRVIVHKRTNFYFADGVWYRARGRKYVVCAAPIGVRVSALPRGNKVVVVNGRRLYKYKGIWYRKSGRNFVVVTV